MKDELGEKITRNLFGLRGKTYRYFTDDGSKDKKARDLKKCVIKKET